MSEKPTFDPVDPRQSFPALEHGILKYWRGEDTFKRSIAARRRQGGEIFSFYDGPPFATGLPHYGHLLAGTIKDVIPRYQTMRGKIVERRFGWDCHGLPVEVEVEKEHGIQSRKEIEAMGVATFNNLCRGAVQRYTKEWRVTVERMGRWVDMDFDYRTMDPDYMESIWWVMKQLHDRGLLYEGYKSMHICPRCQTTLSNFEVSQGYKDITDLGVTAKFHLIDEPQETAVLAWTTTAWTLPGNLFLALSRDTPYVRVAHEDSSYVLAKARLEEVFRGKTFSIEEEWPEGSALFGKRYSPLFPYEADHYREKAFRIVDGSTFVSTEEGTGVVHIATGFGEDDYAVGKREGVGALQHVGPDGRFRGSVKDFAGLEVKPADDPQATDRKVAAWLQAHEKLFDSAPYVHSYPHCWRCDAPLLNYATSSWFVAVEKIKEQLLAANAETTWVPGHIRDGRFGKWLENARDWAISRQRYWGTPLPIWRCGETGELEVLGSRDDVTARKRIRFTKITVLRHGESEGNITPIYQGRLPGTSLTDHGRAQVRRTAETLGETEVTCIYTSPLARTMQTAEILAKETGARVIIDDRIRETRFGAYEGKTVDFTDLSLVRARRAHKLSTGSVESVYHFPGMETWKEVQERMEDFLLTTLPKHRGEHIVIVTHADPLLTLRQFFEREDPLKLVHQPYPAFAESLTFFWDHVTHAALDLHKERMDALTWQGSPHASSVSVTLVRHAATDWNTKGLVQGCEADPPLDAGGKAQAEDLARGLRKQSFDVMLTSHLKRTKETGEMLAKTLKVPSIESWEILRERDAGAWSGKPVEEILKENPGAFEGVNPGFHHLTPPGGESLAELLHRAEEASSKIRERFPGKRVLLVSHRGFLQAFRTVAENLSYTEAIAAKLGNSGLTDVTLHPLFRRIPDVLDCWFESGSMPYAQFHFPFSPRAQSTLPDTQKGERSSKLKAQSAKFPPGFPADFIAEGIDQTRGWFYTLMVLATALFTKPAFRHCIVNGTVLAEDGKKMSKRLKNYPEPLEIVEQYGADATRFALMQSPAVRGEDLRFSTKLVEEALRNVLLPLWNTYAFFVTYANAAGWSPAGTRRESGHPLDRWIRAEVQDLVNRMTEQIDAYDLSATCAELHDTIDALTHWYVRLSRRRFAGKMTTHGVSARKETHTEEQADALQTLEDVLLTLTQLLAPFCPFITEAITLNLVPEEHGSVHLSDWPAVRSLTEEEREMIARTRVLRTIVSLGLRIRSEQKIKVRQPLPKARVALPVALGTLALTHTELQLIEEELNVKTVEVIEDASDLATAVAAVDPRKAGPRLGSRVQEVIAAGKRGDFTTQDDGSILILEERLTLDEVQILYRGREGENVASDRGIVVSIETAVTEELRLEGGARDLIRAVQQLRKDAGLSVQDRITLQIDGAEHILRTHHELIAQETNARFGASDGEPHIVELVDGPATLRLHKTTPS